MGLPKLGIFGTGFEYFEVRVESSSRKSSPLCGLDDIPQNGEILSLRYYDVLLQVLILDGAFSAVPNWSRKMIYMIFNYMARGERIRKILGLAPWQGGFFILGQGIEAKK